jgi:hypothetical protein
MKIKNSDNEDISQIVIEHQSNDIFSEATSEEDHHPTYTSKRFSRISTIILSCFIIAAIILNIIFSFLENFREYSFFFDGRHVKYIPLKLSIIMSIILQLIFAFFFTGHTYSLIRNRNQEFLRIYNKNFSYMFIFFQMCFLILCISKIINLKNQTFELIIGMVLQLICLLPVIYIYSRVKRNIGIKKFGCIFYQVIFISFLLAFIIFILIDEIGVFISVKFMNFELRWELCIVLNITLSLIGIALLATFKDIFFAIFIIYVEVSFIINLNYISTEELITSICSCVVMIFGVLGIVIKYKRKIFGPQDQELTELLEKNYKEQYKDG